MPKSYLPNYREFYEQRYFSAARDAVTNTVTVLGQTVPFGADLIFEATDLPGFALHVEICEDGWVAIPPSTWASLAGATVLANLSGSPVTVGKESYRKSLCTGHSARCIAAHLYVAAGCGESTTDLAWDADALITENGTLLARSEQFSMADQIITADIDLDRLRQERLRMISLRDQAGDFREQLKPLRRITFTFGALDGTDNDLRRLVPRFPFVPTGTADRDERCREVRNIRVQGLAQRLRSTGLQKIVIGVSGGLDSTLALLVAVDTFDRIGLPRTNILAYTMPGFATGGATLRRAHELMDSLGVSGTELDIRPRANRCSPTWTIRMPRARRFSISPSRTCKRANGPHICSGSPIITVRSCWVPAISRSWRWAGAPTVSAIRCRTTTSTRRCPKPLSST